MLYGERVTLRAVTPEDYPRLAQFKNDLEIELLGGGTPPRPTPPAQVAEFFDDLAKKKDDDIRFAIEVDATMIGDVGLFRFDRVAATAEVGIGIGDRAYWGHGYGREAMALVVDYGFRMQNLRRIYLETYSNNPRAVRSYAAVGFVEEGRLREHGWNGGEYVDVVMMGLLRSEWPGLPADWIRSSRTAESLS
jgi:RimJ/RimL family protein N-acetyltransferase